MSHYETKEQNLPQSKLRLDKEDQASKNLLKAVLEIEMESLKYTKECAELIGKPQPDMVCRIEHKCPSRDRLVVDVITFKFETEKEYCGIDGKGFCFGVDKGDFIAWHPVDERSELDVAKEKQVKSAAQDIHSSMLDITDDLVMDLIVMLQDRGHLAEIILPLQK